jgi:hypothetical protein
MICEGLEILEADMPFGVLNRQRAALGAMPSFDKAATHIVNCISDMDLQLPTLSLLDHHPAFPAARSADSVRQGCSAGPPRAYFASGNNSASGAER